MNTWRAVEAKLLDLEVSHFGLLVSRYAPSAALEVVLTDYAQFGAIDKDGHEAGSLPVVCAVGINYTQDSKSKPIGKLKPLLRNGDKATVVDNLTTTRRGVVDVMAAHSRNREAWAETTAIVWPRGSYRPENGIFASNEATVLAGLLSPETSINGPFIFVMTNFCPLITQSQWSETVRKYPQLATELLRDYNADDYLDNLVRSLGHSVDLWIGHSAIRGEDFATNPEGWVWPRFGAFVHRHNIKSWLLSPNLSGRTHNLHTGRGGQLTKNWLAPLFS
jgi:hypothetical protein